MRNVSFILQKQVTDILANSIEMQILRPQAKPPEPATPGVAPPLQFNPLQRARKEADTSVWELLVQAGRENSLLGK